MTHEEVWDDTLLVEQYDAAMEQVKQQMTSNQLLSDGFHSCSSKKLTSSKKKKKKNAKKLEWQVGQACRCKYEEDGQVYEATILSISSDGKNATISYVGYGNNEEVLTSQLYKSKGNSERRRQEKDAEQCAAIEDQTDSAGGDGASSSQFSDDVPRAGEWMPVNSHSEDCSSTANSASFVHHHTHHAPGMGYYGRMSGPPLPPLPPPPGIIPPPPHTSEALHTMLLSWYMTGFHTGFYQGVSAKQTRRGRKR